MEAKHTPGPWHVRRRDKIVTSEHGCYEGGDAPATIAAYGYHLATIRPVNDWHANAALIAAAPDLLAACKEAKEMIDCMDYELSVMCQCGHADALLTAAIAKANSATLPAPLPDSHPAPQGTGGAGGF